MRFFLRETTNKILMQLLDVALVVALDVALDVALLFCKIKRNLKPDPKIYDYVPVLRQNDKPALNKIFLKKNH